MNRITATLATLKESGRKALVTYFVNGDPRPSISLPAMHALVESGADIIEVGVPFSDPMAEGPTIQRGHERALEHNVSLTNTLALVSAFRETNTTTPVVLMGYANPVERMGYDAFAVNAKKAGVDGLLTVDLPPEEAPRLTDKLKEQGLESIFLLAPTSTDERMDKIVNLASGFLYYVSLNGVTGAGNIDTGAVNARVDLIRSKTTTPVLVGFGIKDAESAKKVGANADGVIVGSVLVKAMGETENQSDDEICAQLKEKVSAIRAGLDSL